MPYTMKIQPVDFNSAEEPQQPKCEAVVKPIFKSRFKRLLEKPFSSVLKISAPDKPTGADKEEFEPSSVCLAKMVQNFMEEGGEKQQQQRCGRNRCNCFNRNCTESSDEEPDSYNSSLTHACDILKSMVLCVDVSERNLLADTAKIVEKHNISKRKDDCRKLVADNLLALGYNASICKSKWEQSPSFLAGEYEYVDVIIEGERLIVDIDFRSEFDIARATKAYKLVLQTLSTIFVGKPDRLEKIIGIASEAAKLSLKKKGMPLPPWRKAEYVKSKWLSPFTRISSAPISLSSTITNNQESELMGVKAEAAPIAKKSSFKLILGEKNQLSPDDRIEEGDCVFVFSNSSSSSSDDEDGGGKSVRPKWEPPEIRPKNHGVKIVTGLASVIDKYNP
ncbi:hypothetical protein ACS0TY_007460 [Phlomoides rotata]